MTTQKFKGDKVYIGEQNVATGADAKNMDNLFELSVGAKEDLYGYRVVHIFFGNILFLVKNLETEN